MKTLGILTGFHIALLGAAPPLFSPVHFQLAMHGNDPRSLSSALLDHFDPELRQLQDQWRRLPLNESPAQGSALFYFIVHYLETPVSFPYTFTWYEVSSDAVFLSPKLWQTGRRQPMMHSLPRWPLLPT